MTKNKIIVKQLRKIAKLKKARKAYEKRVSNFDNSLHCIGGPLNDNKLEFTKEQLEFIVTLKNLFHINYK